jgi:hypothetical protein
LLILSKNQLSLRAEARHYRFAMHYFALTRAEARALAVMLLLAALAFFATTVSL